MHINVRNLNIEKYCTFQLYFVDSNYTIKYDIMIIAIILLKITNDENYD